MSTPAPTPSDKLQKASAAAALLLILGIIVLVIFASIKSYFDGLAKDGEMAKLMGSIEQIEASQDPPALKSKKFLEIAYSTWDVADAIDARHSQNYVLNRVGQHVQAGYNLTDPLSPTIFDKAAEATCIIRVKQVNEKAATFERDNYAAYQAAKYDLEAWRPYLADYNKVWSSCAYRFQFMQSRYEKKQEQQKSVSMRDVGAKVGEATAEVGKWWDSATKPLSDAVDEFKSGYNSGK
ncbi:hypothetical protein AWN88_14270 [Agrobacterium tumefaciens]|nr:hypothetical protein AWN88_14270 [Agrobacterium tumefaciens]KAJ34047.1 hypothetical protein BW45_06090 [Agrobacterium tumefaciens]